jgi:hypothetical protein
MPAPTVTAHMLVRFLDGDEGKAARLRGRLRALSMVKRDSTGAVVLEQLLDGDRGKPPRRDR